MLYAFIALFSPTEIHLYVFVTNRRNTNVKHMKSKRQLKSILQTDIRKWTGDVTLSPTDLAMRSRKDQMTLRK